MSESGSSRGESHDRGVSRKDFLRAGAVGGAALAAGVVTPAAGAREVRAAGPGPLRHVVPDFELEEATIRDLQGWMEEGRYSARDLARLYLERIEELDRRGPTLRAVLEVNPQAMEIAGRLDRERAEGRIRGPLHGIPVILKDNLDSGDRMMTTAGSLALYGSRAARDAEVTRRLREAGALILAKANLSEWANFRSSNSSSGWSGRGGQGKNPFVLDRNPCGSSSGTGSAVSASLVAAGVGTETNGSVVCPSHANGLVGVKPSLGLVSRSGIVPIAHSQDTAGPMCRTVTDAAILLSAMAGPDERDPETLNVPRQARDADYTRHLRAGDLAGLRIGIPRNEYYGYSPEADRVAEEAMEVLRVLGAEVVDPAGIPTAGEFGSASYQVLLYEFKADLNAYLEGRGPDAPVRSLADVIEFNRSNREREMPYFGQDIMEMAQEKGPLTEAAYRDALEKSKRLAGPEGIDAVMEEHRLDALMAPTGSPAWPIDLVNGDHFTGASSGPAAVAGYPNITVPAGFAFGLPVGMSFFGRRWSEALLLRIAFAFEQEMGARKAPRFLPTAEL